MNSQQIIGIIFTATLLILIELDGFVSYWRANINRSKMRKK